MFVEERQNSIIAILNTQGKVKVKDLSEEFNVTEDCIRKDLAVLEKRGLLKRTYGGAIKNRINTHDISVSQRIDKDIELKKIIAQKSMRLISNGDMIFLDISTANIELAKLLIKSDLDIIVVTNMIDIMLLYQSMNAKNIIFVGGRFSRILDGFVGCLTNEILSNYKFDVAFMGVVGVDLDKNVVQTYDIEDGLTKKMVLDVSRKKYMMLQSNKLFLEGNFNYCKVSNFTGAILDKELPETIKSQFLEYNLECY